MSQKQASLASFFAKKPASGASSATPPPPASSAGAATAGKRQLLESGDSGSASAKRPNTLPSTDTAAKQSTVVMGGEDTMEVDDEMPLAAISRKAASSIMDMEASSSCETELPATTPEAAPSKPRAAPPVDVAAVYAAAAALPAASSPPPNANEKTLSFAFLRDRHDAAGKRPGEVSLGRLTTLTLALALTLTLTLTLARTSILA